MAGDVSQDRREGLVCSGRIPFGAQQHRYVEAARMDDEIIKAADVKVADDPDSQVPF